MLSLFTAVVEWMSPLVRSQQTDKRMGSRWEKKRQSASNFPPTWCHARARYELATSQTISWPTLITVWGRARVIICALLAHNDWLADAHKSDQSGHYSQSWGHRVPWPINRSRAKLVSRLTLASKQWIMGSLSMLDGLFLYYWSSLDRERPSILIEGPIIRS